MDNTHAYSDDTGASIWFDLTHIEISLNSFWRGIKRELQALTFLYGVYCVVFEIQCL